MTSERAALAYAASLDKTLTAGPDDETHDRLMHVGNLLGGLSAEGFVIDLERELENVAADVRVAWGSAWPWIDGEIETACDDAAARWLAEATAVMEQEHAREAA